MARILKGVAATIRVAIYNADDLTDPDGQAVTITLTRLDGTTAQASTAATRESVGLYRFQVTPTIAASLDTLTATWAFVLSAAAQSVQQTYEVVGDHLFTLAEARGFGDLGLADQARYTDAALAGARDRIAEEFERICGTSFVRRARRVVLSGSRRSADGASIWVPDVRVSAVIAASTRDTGTQTWTALTASELADVLCTETGRLERESLGVWPYGTNNVRVQYEYGWEHPPDAVRRAALVLLRNHVVASDITHRALSLTDELGTYRFSAAGERGAWFGLPDVDAVLDRYNAGLKGMA